MNKYELEQEQFAANGTVFILAFSPNTKLAINTSSEQSDYAVKLNGSDISFVKLNNGTKWRFAFKAIIRRSYFSSVLTLKEKFGYGQVPQSVQWFSIGLNRSDDYSLQILYEKSYRFIGNFFTFFILFELFIISTTKTMKFLRYEVANFHRKYNQ